METYLNKYLLKQKLINLKELKMVEGTKKKVVSSCIFIPESPKIGDKSFSYFTGVIKSIETFHIIMEKKSWIYRLYVDDLFFSGLKKEGSKTKYAYNNVSSNSSPDEKLRFSRMEETPKSYRKKVKRNIRENRDNLKKLQTLMNLYLQKIIDSEDDRYSNIEIITFRCNKTKLTGKYPGHANTFGSIMRFFPIFDSNVDIFISVNSRYPMNLMMKLLIYDFYKRREKKVLAFSYPAKHFIPKCLKQSIDKYVLLLKEGWEQPNIKLFEGVINDIFELKSEICPTSEKLLVKNLSTKEIIEGLYHSDNKTEAYYSIAAGFFGMKRDPALFEKRIEIFAKLLRFLILERDKFIFGIDEVLLKLVLAVEPGTMNISQEIPHQSISFKDSKGLRLKTITNSQILKRLEADKQTYLKGVEGNYRDATIQQLKKANPRAHDYDLLNTLSEINNLGKTDINYCYFLEHSDDCEHTPMKIYKKDFKGLTNSKDQPLTLDPILNDKYISVLDGDLYSVAAYQTRSLFVTNDKTKKKLEKGDKIKVYFDSGDDFQSIEIDIPLLISDYSEYRKLFIYDSKDYYGSLKILFKYFDENYFVPIDINDYPLEDINCLVNLVVNHYRKNNDVYQLIDYQGVLAEQHGSGKAKGIKTRKNKEGLKKTKTKTKKTGSTSI